jgi:pimeloyl-ACP methyl ester carboxylesterase
MENYDDNLERFAASGALPLPQSVSHGYVDHDGAHIWYASYGSGFPIILLHGGLGHSGNWGYQVPALVQNGYRAIVIDSRGHGRSTRDSRQYSYQLMGSDVLAVMDILHIEKAVLLGWSDGACTSLVLARQFPERVSGVFYFACNMDPTDVKLLDESDIKLQRCFTRHQQDYIALSSTLDQFKALFADLSLMQKSQPDYSASDLAEITVPVVVVQGEHDEFIWREHAEYLARNIPRAELIILEAVSHFAPLQRPDLFNSAVLRFFSKIRSDNP